VGFTAVSQAVLTKAPTPLSQYHNDFGVWGIARQAINDDYILWDDNDLTQVIKSSTSDVFVPVDDAYWFTGYEYDFIAVAPYTASGISSTSINNATNTLTFAYDLSPKYALKGATGLQPKDHYQFDLMAAADHTDPIPQTKPSTQNLIFWHLFSQIEIENIGFAPGINGTVTNVRFKAYPSGQYTISYDNSIANKTATTGVTCETITKKADNTDAAKAELTFENPNFSSTATRPIFNIIPQKVAYLELYIDFTINEGTSSVQYQGFKIDLTSQELTEYEYNGKYNWDITIGTKNAVSFNVVQINDWQTGTVPDEIPLQ
jgi:hypothetical protein